MKNLVRREVKIGDGSHLSDEILVHDRGDTTERLENVRNHGDHAVGHFSDSLDFSWVSNSFTGQVRHGEEGNERICNILIARLNRDGTQWANVVACQERTTNVDCESVDGDKKLLIQVTRAQRGEFWRRASQDQGIADYAGKYEAAHVLREAIEAKIKVKFASRSARRNIVLALDAIDTLGFVLTPVVESFRERHGKWAAELGFEAIWVVGPNPDFVFRLDQSRTHMDK